jgi:signal-transduction protein with cAMP-binding, CBS, and nucleotidyltransferase domain
MAPRGPVGYSRVVVSELHDVRDFLAGRPPFVVLPAAALDELPRSVTVRYLRRGSGFPAAEADPSELYLRRKGAVEIRDAAGALQLPRHAAYDVRVDAMAAAELFLARA